jgi:hypothetical protein
MYREAEAGALTHALDKSIDSIRRERSVTLGFEDEGAFGCAEAASLSLWLVYVALAEGLPRLGVLSLDSGFGITQDTADSDPCDFDHFKTTLTPLTVNTAIETGYIGLSNYRIGLGH